MSELEIPERAYGLARETWGPGEAIEAAAPIIVAAAYRRQAAKLHKWADVCARSQSAGLKLAVVRLTVAADELDPEGNTP